MFDRAVCSHSSVLFGPAFEQSGHVPVIASEDFSYVMNIVLALPGFLHGFGFGMV